MLMRASALLSLALFVQCQSIVDRSRRKPHLSSTWPPDRVAVVGTDAELSCRVISDTEGTMQWMKSIEVNGSYVGPDQSPFFRVLKTGLTSDKDMATLHLSNVSLDDAGVYTCHAANSWGETRRSSALTVVEEALPAAVSVVAIDLSGKELNVESGANVEMQCYTGRQAQATITWRKYSRAMRKDVDLKSGFKHENYAAILWLRNVSMEDAGRYTCSVHDQVELMNRVFLRVTEGA
ncbi:uncharacterized protein V6R79_019875 [Siganus canaliculatus]